MSSHQIHDHSHGHDHSYNHGHDRHNQNVDADEEAAHFQSVIAAFRHYKRDIYSKISRAEDDFAVMPKAHQDLVPHFKSRMIALRTAADVNQEFLDAMCAPHQMFENREMEESNFSIPNSNKKEEMMHTRAFDLDKVRSTVKQFVRDWAPEGAEERRICYQPFIDELCSRYPDTLSRGDISVLVPGAGLGRLAFEFARLGFRSQGNEFSYYMLIASNFILNRTAGGQFPIHPFIHNFCNNIAKDDQARAVMIPDVVPGDELGGAADFSMVAGDFLECYTEEGTWNAVCTCFFIDTAKDIIEYIETIWRILKPGGVWVNLGPLLYHFTEMCDPSLELSYEEVMEVVKATGFRVEVPIIV